MRKLLTDLLSARLDSYQRALVAQPISPILHAPAIGYALIAVGNILVLSSMWALGITGTYLGDYFGILMDQKVEGFPFNITGAPMYYGSTCSFLGTAILYERWAGVMLTAEVLVVYLVALSFEEYVFCPFFPFSPLKTCFTSNSRSLGPANGCLEVPLQPKYMRRGIGKERKRQSEVFEKRIGWCT